MTPDFKFRVLVEGSLSSANRGEGRAKRRRIPVKAKQSPFLFMENAASMKSIHKLH